MRSGFDWLFVRAFRTAAVGVLENPGLNHDQNQQAKMVRSLPFESGFTLLHESAAPFAVIVALETALHLPVAKAEVPAVLVL